MDKKYNLPIPRNYRKEHLTETEVKEIHDYYWAHEVTAEDMCNLVGCCLFVLKEKFKKFGYSFRTKKQAHTISGKKRRGPKCANWKGKNNRKINNGGYIQIPHPDGGKTPSGYPRTIMEHRYVYQQAHGPIPDDWHVHHINGIKTDNRLENLEAMSGSEHMRYIPMLKSKIFNLEQSLYATRQNHDNGVADY